MQVAVVDYGMGNLRSVMQALAHVAPDVDLVLTQDPQQVLQADKVVFPGQGAMPDCIREIDRLGLRAALLQAASEKPFLGICIGLQLLFQHSAEGPSEGLGLLAGDVARFPSAAAGAARLKVPQMGWNQAYLQREHALWHHIAPDARFYFVHSYYVRPAQAELVLTETEHGLRYCSAVAQAHLCAVQFHPEKSSDAGLQLLKNFVQWDGR